MEIIQMNYTLSSCCNISFVRSLLFTSGLHRNSIIFVLWMNTSYFYYDFPKVSAFFDSYYELKVYFVAFAYAIVYMSCWNAKLCCRLFYASFKASLILWHIPFVQVHISTVGFSVWVEWSLGWFLFWWW